MSWLILAQSVKSSEIKVPQGDITSITFRTVYFTICGLAAAICLLIIALAAFRYVSSRGNPQETAKAKNTIIYALVGLVICLTAFSVVGFVMGFF